MLYYKYVYREKLDKIPNIKQNIHESIYDIVYNMDKITPPETIQNEETKLSVDYILKLGPDEPPEYTEVSILNN